MHLYGTFFDRPNGITKRTDAVTAGRGVCRRKVRAKLA